jgi:hypothetical protein
MSTVNDLPLSSQSRDFLRLSCCRIDFLPQSRDLIRDNLLTFYNIRVLIFSFFKEFLLYNYQWRVLIRDYLLIFFYHIEAF